MASEEMDDIPGGFISSFLLSTPKDFASEDDESKHVEVARGEHPPSPADEMEVPEDEIVEGDVDEPEERGVADEVVANGEVMDDRAGATTAYDDPGRDGWAGYDAPPSHGRARGSKLLTQSKRGLRDDDMLQMGPPEDNYDYEEVDYSQNSITEIGLEPILGLCARCPNLRVLKLFKNSIGDKGAQQLEDFLYLCPGVREVHLSHNRLTEKGIESLVAFTQKSRPQNAEPLWLRVEYNHVADPKALLRDLEQRHGVCPRYDACTQFRCSKGSRVHLPFLDLDRERREKENVRRDLGLRAADSPVRKGKPLRTRLLRRTDLRPRVRPRAHSSKEDTEMQKQTPTLPSTRDAPWRTRAAAAPPLALPGARPRSPPPPQPRRRVMNKSRSRRRRREPPPGTRAGAAPPPRERLEGLRRRQTEASAPPRVGPSSGGTGGRDRDRAQERLRERERERGRERERERPKRGPSPRPTTNPNPTKPYAHSSHRNAAPVGRDREPERLRKRKSSEAIGSSSGRRVMPAVAPSTSTNTSDLQNRLNRLLNKL